jgi:sigma-B regulation protein RsbU (phosphoserine phosphatase)
MTKNNEDKPKHTVLAVDDTPENLDVVKGILTPEYIVKAAVNGKMALKIAQAKPPDLILLDIMMPEMDGYEVCTALKANPDTRDIPVIFLTAMDQTQDETRGFELGAADYIMKPVSPPVLEARVKTHLALKQNMDELQKAYGVIKGQKDRMQEELNVGRDIQMSLIPRDFPAFPDNNEFDVYAILEPAREVGGDLYDFYFLDGERLCFCIGDVSGKGVPAALFMAMTKTLIKSRSVDDYSTASITTHVNDELSEENPQSMFVTLFLAILNIRSGELLYTNAGHNPSYVKRADGTVEPLKQLHGPIVGAMPGLTYKEASVKLEKGDGILLYTDGVTEAMNAAGDLYSDPRLDKLVESMTFESTSRVTDTVMQDVVAFEAGAERADDITILALTYNGVEEGKESRTLEIKIHNDLTEIDRVNQEFGAFIEQWEIPAALGYKFSVAFDELLNNTISYAYQDDNEHQIDIRVDFSGDRLVVTIEDDGMPYNPFTREAPDTSLSLEEREIGGLGVHLVRKLMEEVSYHRKIDTNVITLVHRVGGDR